MNRSAPLTRKTPLPSGASLTRYTGLPAGSGFRPARLALVEGSGAVVLAPASWQRRRTDTGFPRSVKLAVRKRAGGGDPDDAMCEACGKWLGRKHGQVHHRVNRGSGGCADEVINGCANAALLCGTPHTGCHGLATALDPDMKDRGFVVEHGTTPEYDPRNVPVVLASQYGSGVTVLLLEDGTYSLETPEGAA